MDNHLLTGALGAAIGAGICYTMVSRTLSAAAAAAPTQKQSKEVVTPPAVDVSRTMASMLSGSGTELLPSKKIVILGMGNFGTAMAVAVARNGHDVVAVVRDGKQAEHINTHHKNNKYLQEFDLPTNITATTDLAAAVKGCFLIISALPCQRTPVWLEQHKDVIPPDVLVCSTCKGLYLPTKQLIGHAMLDALGRAQPLAFLSGPGFAAGIVKGDPTALVVASQTLYHAVLVQRVMSSMKMRVYTSQDIVGVQLGGALKNPLAVGAGMVAGMGFGINTLSAFITRGAGELSSLCSAMGGEEHTIAGLSGIGDLMLTAMSSQSRNQKCGQRLIKGDSIEDILKDMTVEGVPTASVAVAYADVCGLDLPIFRMVNAVISGEMTPQEALPFLMSKPIGQERTGRAGGGGGVGSGESA